MSPFARLVEALTAASPADALRGLDREGLLTAAIPELEEGRGFRQPELHAYSVLDHQLATVAAFDAATGQGSARADHLRAVTAWYDLDGAFEASAGGFSLRVLTRLACLVHDVAKPATSTFREGRLRFPRHGPLGAEMMAARLPAAGLGDEATDVVCRLVRYHLRPGDLVRGQPITDRAVRRLVHDVGGYVAPLLLLNLSDGWATRGPRYTDEHFERHCALVNYLLVRAWAATAEGEPALLTGEDLMSELHMTSGRLLGAVLLSVRRAQEERRITTREDALKLARAVLRDIEPGHRPTSDAQG